MPIVHAQLFHRLALAVTDATAAERWFREVLGAAPVTGRSSSPFGPPGGGGGEHDLAGVDSRMLWLGGRPLILLAGGVSGGPVHKHLARYGPSVQSLAWEIEDMWTTEHRLRERGISIAAVNIPGRHFFMHPRDTHGLLLEWTDTTIGNDHRRGAADPGEGGGTVEVDSLAWITGVVADADAAAEFLIELGDGTLVEGNPRRPDAIERTVDVAVGDVTVRLVTPRSEESPYAAVAARPRLWSFTLGVGDLDKAIEALGRAGVTVSRRDGDLALSDPATTLGVPIEWTS